MVSYMTLSATKIIFIAFLFFLCVSALIVVVIFYATQPALNREEMPKMDIVQYSSPADVTPPKDPRTLKVVTYNIGYASGDKNNKGSVLIRSEVRDNLDNMILELQQIDPDVIALQEVDFYAARSFDINQLEYLARGLNMPYAAYAVNWSKRYVPWPFWPPHKHFGRIVSGQGILSRYPVTGHEAIYFEKPESNSFLYNLGYLDRVAQRVTLKLNSKEISFWNVHLEAYDENARLKQVHRLADIINKEEFKDIIIAGDFNSDLDGKALRQFIQLSQSKNAESPTTGFTYPSWEPARKIDHIVYKGVLMTESHTLSGLLASDHLPVWAEFNLE